jgi:hypothetical protein
MVFQDPSLRQLWQCGRKFRIPAHPAVLIPDIKRGLSEYTDQLARSHKMDHKKFQPWTDYILHKIEQAVIGISETDWLTNGGLTQQGFRELRKIQAHMVIGSCDKSAHDLMIICEHAYIYALQKELQSGVYQQTALTDEQIWSNHANLSQKLAEYQLSPIPTFTGRQRCTRIQPTCAG